jgi:acyl-CoA dehydrogenase
MGQRCRAEATLTESQRLVQRSIRAICGEYDHEYWREKSRKEEYPHEFVDTLGEEGWMGALLPEEYGGAELSTEEIVVMMEEIAAEGGGFAAAQAIHGGLYNSVPIVEYGSEELKAGLLPDVARGETRIQAFGLTEPNAGSESTAIETFAERVNGPGVPGADTDNAESGGDDGSNGDDADSAVPSSAPDAAREKGGYVVNGSKIWTSRVDVSDYLLLIARTTPIEAVEKRTHGISMFLVDLAEAREQGALDSSRIPKSASEFVHSYQLFFEDLWLPEGALVGEEGEGFYQVLDGLNEERLVIAAECIGLGELALERAIDYANEREVFDRPIGTNQAVQHPLAEAYTRVQGAKAVTYAAARADASGREAGARANTAKYLASEAAFDAADAAVQTHGGFGVATEYDVERYFREARLSRLVPITQELALNYLGENVLGRPRSNSTTPTSTAVESPRTPIDASRTRHARLRYSRRTGTQARNGFDPASRITAAMPGAHRDRP